ALDHLTKLPVASAMISYAARKATQVPRRLSPIPCHSFRDSEPAIASVMTFIEAVVTKSGVSMRPSVVGLLFLRRLRLCPARFIARRPTSIHEAFLAAVILATKNIDYTSPKNKHWTRYNWLQSRDGDRVVAEINLTETQLLGALNWNIRISLEDLYSLLQPVLA
ncbi:hypothetical protein BKA63DRAFT_371207, partial [Paraphoma chrysanthemicola]